MRYRSQLQYKWQTSLAAPWHRCRPAWRRMGTRPQWKIGSQFTEVIRVHAGGWRKSVIFDKALTLPTPSTISKYGESFWCQATPSNISSSLVFYNKNQLKHMKPLSIFRLGGREHILMFYEICQSAAPLMYVLRQELRLLLFKPAEHRRYYHVSFSKN